MEVTRAILVPPVRVVAQVGELVLPGNVDPAHGASVAGASMGVHPLIDAMVVELVPTGVESLGVVVEHLLKANRADVRVLLIDERWWWLGGPLWGELNYQLANLVGDSRHTHSTQFPAVPLSEHVDVPTQVVGRQLGVLCLQLLDQLLVARLLSTFSGGACCSSTWSRGLLLRD